MRSWLGPLALLAVLAALSVYLVVLLISPPVGYTVERIPDFCVPTAGVPTALAEQGGNLSFDTYVVLNGEDYWCSDYGWLASAKPATR